MLLYRDADLSSRSGMTMEESRDLTTIDADGPASGQSPVYVTWHSQAVHHILFTALLQGCTMQLSQAEPILIFEAGHRQCWVIGLYLHHVIFIQILT